MSKKSSNTPTGIGNQLLQAPPPPPPAAQKHMVIVEVPINFSVMVEVEAQTYQQAMAVALEAVRRGENVQWQQSSPPNLHEAKVLQYVGVKQ